MTRQQLGTCDGVGGRIAHPEGHACVHWKPVSRPKQMCSDCASYPCIEGCRCPCHRKPALPELLEKACDHECGYDQAHFICKCVKCGTTYPNKEATFLDRNRGAQPEPDERAFAKKWLADHQLEPLKCEACGQAQSLAPMASGDVWAGCPKAPAGCGHTYTITIGGENKEFERYAACISDYLQARAGSSPAEPVNPTPNIWNVGNYGKRVEAGVTGNEGKDGVESRGKDIAVDGGTPLGDRAGSAGVPLPDAPLASPAVVTPEPILVRHGPSWGWEILLYLHKIEGIWDTKEAADKYVSVVLQPRIEAYTEAKVSELEAQLQQADELVKADGHRLTPQCSFTGCDCGGVEAYKAARANYVKSRRAELERMRAGGKQCD